jgi:DNA-binding CsgD family transcriptional regulator
MLAAWDTAVRGGIRADALGEDLHKVVNSARTTRERVDWDVLIELKDRVREQAGGRDGLERVYLGYHKHFAELGRLAKLFASPRQLYRFHAETLGIALYSHLQLAYSETGRGRVRLELTLPPEYRDGTSFFEATVSKMKVLPAFLDLPFAEVEAEVSSHRGVYEIRPPASRNALAGRMPQSVRALLDELQHLAEQLQSMTRMSAAPARPGLDKLARQYGLTPRQREVAALLVKGASNKEIAGSLGCAERTVELHVTALMRKTSTQNRTQLAARLLVR